MSVDNLKARVVGAFPLLTKYVCKIPWVENLDIPTIRTNGHQMEYNPDFLFSRDPADQLFLATHEYAHIFLGHPLRKQKGWDEAQFQEAADYVTNGMLVGAGMNPPEDVIYNYLYRDMGLEEVYELIRKQQSKKNSPPPKYDPDAHGECEQDPAMGQGEEAEAEAVEDHRKEQIEAITSAKMCGNMPDNVLRVIDEITESKKNWKDILANLVYKVAGKDRYTFSKPNRRSFGDVILPSMHSEKSPCIVLAGDTSISVDFDQLKSQCDEIVGLTDAVEPEELYVLWVDTKVAGVQVLSEDSMEELKPVGGGGTNFKPPFEYVEKEGLEPEVFIYLTDGECHRFPPEPDYPVIWVIWSKHKFRPPFGEVLYM